MGKTSFTILVVLPFITSFLSLFLGSYIIPPETILRMIFMKLISPSTHSPWPATYETIIFDIRLPRIVLALLGGVALSVSGASLQTVFRNPLVDSYILGISAGAGFGAALAIAVIPYAVSIQLSAFIFGLLAFFITYSIAKTRSGTPIVSLILAGVIVTSLFSAGISLIKFFTDPHRLAGVVTWLMGSLAVSGWGNVVSITPSVFIGFIALFLMRWRLNVLSMGDEEARSLGINVERDRFIVLLAATLMVSSFTSIAGIIGWIGLMVPHMARMFLRSPDNRVVIPASACIGSALLLLADDAARCLTTYELPVGVLTTIGGAPFFLYLLKRGGARAWRE
ncbi:MAG: iron ABC transporter permease [Thermoproteota archaeon]|jgi:iron complex transport system permease protein|uniref:Iron ABC transporter permease n=1 Tax=Candidatus Methanodesulfokora washburnensis TaxID=2478471 RepID=A0A429GEX5_9CREN|nr:iron ABC transporter permease [Candidatus Methanodesulfokores washburnensis]RSN72420.1 iron ABC transporter permease [Candidatus Methanodesulfokores washburnensis]RZN62557.1 MAG: iron ABC transporter permease [Candidatus Methanodesulfokores washburnensis]TDA40802.1 MAG: iron ABC transporter permease [Candidatus Korarchaeota archaeon]